MSAELFDRYVQKHYSRIEHYPPFVQRILIGGFKRFFYDERIETFLYEHRDDDAKTFIASVLEYFRIAVSVKQNELSHIPSYGRCVVVANHPLGAIDALALLHVLLGIRKDVSIVANDFLSSIDNLNEVVIPVDNVNGHVDKKSLRTIYQALSEEGMVVIFPAGEVARNASGTLKDGPWKSGFYKVAKKMRAPILPVVIEASNTKRFYAVSKLHRSLSTMMLVKEMFHSFDKKIALRIGQPVPYDSYVAGGVSTKEGVKLFSKHFRRVAKGKKPLLSVQNGIAVAQDPVEVRKALHHASKLTDLSNGMEVYLYRSDKPSCVIKELGRLRELSFRQVGEGTGKQSDWDRYDLHYDHIVIWNDEAMEIVGAYRVAQGQDVLSRFGFEGLYSHELFRFDPSFEGIANEGLELGRSFVHPKYWNSRALDYLWRGIGSYLKANPHIRYLFGPVSLSNAYTPHARALIVYFYKHYFGSTRRLVFHKARYKVPRDMERYCEEIFCGSDYKADFRVLKEELSYMGFTVPTLYKHYTELCEEGGVRFMDFGYDKDFGYCIDGFITVDLTRIKANKHQRYFGV